MQNLKVYYRRLKQWLYDAWPFGLFSIVFFFAIVLPCPFQLNPVDHVHYTGFLLQFSAFLTIILRINWAHKRFSDDNRDFFGLINEWLKRFPNIFKAPKSVNVDAVGEAFSEGQSMSAVLISTDKTLKQRVADLEKQHKALVNKLNETESRLNKRLNENINETKSQIEQLKKEITLIKNETKVFKVGSLKYEIVWSLWLILGLTIRQFSQEIGVWFM